MEHTIVNCNTGNKIHVNIEVPFIMINENELTTLDIREIELLYLIIDRMPNVLKYDFIIDNFLKKYDITSEYNDPLLYIRKKKHNIHKNIFEINGFDNSQGLIETIRKVGYRINRNWNSLKIKNPTNTDTLKIKDILSKLDNVIDSAIKLQNLIPLEDIEIDNDVIITLNTDGFSKQIDILQYSFIKLSSELLNKLNLSPYENKYVNIESILYLIRSYFSMSRQGTNITHKEWRTMFVDEIQSHFRNLIRIIQS